MSGRWTGSFAIAAFVAVAACSGPRAETTPATTQAVPSVAATASARPPSPRVESPVTFTSPLYGYAIVVPAGWSIRAATMPWDGASAPRNTDSTNDKFQSASNLSAWAYAAPSTKSLAGFVEDNVGWTVRDHGDTCPATGPETREDILIDGQAGRLLSWDCGILINQAVTVRDGTGYVLVMRDLDVKAATDPDDRAVLDQLIDSTILEP
jgi:hypothetical protein